MYNSFRLPHLRAVWPNKRLNRTRYSRFRRRIAETLKCSS